jgi:hypothetical protein
MLKIKLSAKWAAIAIATLMTSLDPLAAGATVQSDPVITAVQMTTAKLTGTNPTLMARATRSAKKKIKKSKSRRPQIQSQPVSTASNAEVEKFWNVYQAGSRSVPGCITDGNGGACDRLSNSKSALTNWCLQGKTEACDLFSTLSSQEGYQSFSDALQRSVQ